MYLYGFDGTAQPASERPNVPEKKMKTWEHWITQSHKAKPEGAPMPKLIRMWPEQCEW